MKTLGCFFFRQTYNNNLIGEFCNENGIKVFTESADLLTYKGKFLGNFYSTWQEKNINHGLYLEIVPKNNSQNIYQLTWTTKKGVKIFSGEGFIVDDFLIGFYYEK